MFRRLATSARWAILMYVISLGFDICSGLLFTCQALQNMQSDKSTELHVCFKRSYDVVLKHHHTFIIRSAVAVRGYIVSASHSI